MSETNQKNGAPVAAVEQNKPAAPVPANAQPPAPARPNAGPTIPVKQNSAPSIPKLQILQRLADGSDDGLPAIIRQLSGGDELFVEKFIVCVKNQVNKGWKRVGNAWINPFQSVPLQSVLDCLYKCATRKILPDGYNAYLVPYCGKNPTCSLQIDYKGLVDCAIREGIVIDADAKEIRENDDFVWNCGEVERFSIDFRKPRGAIIGVCAWAILPNGRKKFHPMSMDEIAEVRGCARDTSIWDKWPAEMAKKSAIRRLFKTLRNSPAVQNLLDMDNENFDLDRQNGSPAQRSAVPASSRRKSSRVPVGGYTAPQIAAQPVGETIEITPAQEAPSPVAADADLDDPFGA